MQPHSLDAEKAALGAVMSSPKAWPAVAAVLTPADFYRDAHRRVFEAARRLAARAVVPDILTVKEELLAAGDLDEVGGPAYVASLTDGVPTPANAAYYAGIVREKARLRAAIKVGEALLSDAYGETEPAAELASAAARRLALAVGPGPAQSVRAATAANEYMADLDAGLLMLQTGFADLDDLLGGVAVKDLTIIAARPSVGKTSFMLRICRHIAGAGQNVAFASREMSRKKLGARLLSWDARVSTNKLERGQATDDEVARVIAAQARLEALPLHIDDTSRTLVEIGAWCRRLQDEHGGLACLAVDYIQIIAADAELARAPRHEQVAAHSSGLKDLAKSLGVAVLAASQLSRAPEGRSDKRPQLSDLRESGALEQDADLAVLLYRPEMHKRTDDNQGLAEAIVAKNRTGPVGVVRLCFIEEFAEFNNLAVGVI